MADDGSNVNVERLATPLDNELSPTPEVPADRLSQLKSYYLDIAGCSDSLQPDTLKYIQEGGSLRLCLAEILKHDQTETDHRLATSRQAYLASLMTRHHVLGRSARRKAIEGRRTEYVDGVVSQVQRVVEAKSIQDALDARQMPTIVRDSTFDDKEPPTPEQLSANQLYVLADTALREHVARRKIISEHSDNNPVHRILGNRLLRMGVAAGVFAASITPSLHVIPVESPEVARDLQLGLELASALVFGYEAPEEVRWRYLDIIHAKRTKQMHERLASDRHLSDLALRMTYNATRYGGLGDSASISNQASPSKEDNLKKFGKLDDEFRHLNNDPGGKPYTGDQALGYAARLLIERRKQIDEILANDKTGEERKETYLKLVKDIVEEDLVRMEKGLSSSRFRQTLWRLAGILPAIIFPGAVATAGNAAGLGQDVSQIGTDQREEYDS